jgi:hypothetical protein
MFPQFPPEDLFKPNAHARALEVELVNVLGSIGHFVDLVNFDIVIFLSLLVHASGIIVRYAGS